MLIQQIGSNMTEVMLADGTEVSDLLHDSRCRPHPWARLGRTAHKWSATTTKHVNRWLTDKLGRTDCVPAVDQWEIDRLLAF